MIAPTINTSELMSLAWRHARQEHWSRRMPEGTLRSLFPAALRWAWVQMRAITANRAAMAARTAADLAAVVGIPRPVQNWVHPTPSRSVRVMVSAK